MLCHHSTHLLSCNHCRHPVQTILLTSLGLFSVYFLLEEVFFEEHLWSVEAKCLFLSESQYVTLKQSIVYDEHSI